MNRLGRKWLLSGALVLAGCGSDKMTGPPPVEVAGRYAGSVQNNDGQSIAILTLTLAETNGAVTGSGSFNNAGVGQSILVAGTYTEPNVSLVISSPGYEDINLSGRVTVQSITGTLNGSGFVGSAVVLNRQQ